ncbi:MBL fold metallo-hydrolase [Rhizobium ruizarguesonis]
MLYRIDPALFRVRVASAEASVARAKATQLNARLQLDRQKSLRDRDVASGIEYDAAAVALAQADADVALAEAIKATGKTLTAIYVSQSDPDYYFSLKPVLEAFPGTKVLAASDTIAAIKGNIEKKLAVWGPQLKENGPQTLADIVMPEAFDAPSLTVDGEPVEIVAAEAGLSNRRYLFVPSLNAVFGGVMIFSGVHVWTADTQAPEQRAAWGATLDKISARKPTIVVPGHMTPEAATDLSAVEHTKSYLLAFEEELAKAADSTALKAAMEARFPGLGMGVALDIGSKVAKGEMKWG